MLGFTIAPSATAAAVPMPPVQPRPSIGQRAGGGLWWLLNRLFLGLPLLALGCVYWLVNQTIHGRFRHHLRPVWVACFAWYATPATPWLWLGAAVTLYLFPRALYLLPMRGDRISRREQASFADAACLLAAWQALTPGLDLPVQVGLFIEFTAAGLAPWWLSRAWRTESEAVEADEILDQWGTDVMGSSRAGDLADTEFWKDEQGRYRLRALPGCATDTLIKLGDHVCSLMRRPRGTVTISHYTDEDGDANDYLVAFTDRADGTRVRYATGPTLDERGTIAVADTTDGRTIRVALYTPAGAAHFLILATNRYGKGVVMRNIGLELCLWDKAFVIVVDAKGDNDGGSGLPELRGAADVYAWRKADWKAAIHMEHELFQARSSRYSGRAAFWHPDKPVDGYCDPLIAAIKDELRNISKSTGRRELDMLEQISSMGATYGFGEYGDSQKGDAESTFSTAWRNDIRGNGTVFAGRAGDSQAAGIAAQDFAIDLSRLPNGQGWWFVKTALTDVPLVPARGRLYPTRDEAEYQPGIEAPYGTVEDWLTMTKRAKLHPQDQDIVERWRPEFVDPTAEPEAGPEPARETVEVAAGVHIEAPPRILHVVPTQPLPDTKAAIDVIVEVLRQSGPMTRGEVAKAVRIADTYASDRLKTLEAQGRVARTATPDGRAAWKATA